MAKDGGTRSAGTHARERPGKTDYRALFDLIDEGFCIVQVLLDDHEKPRDYRFLEYNRRFEEQTGLENAIGKTARTLIPALEEHWFEIYGRVARTGEPERFENCSEPMGRWFDVYAFRIGEPEQRKVAILFRDISRQKQSENALRDREAALEQANRHKDEFLAMLAHELRNPLAPLRNGLEVVRRLLPPDQQSAATLTMMSGQVDHIVRLVDDLLDVSRISRGKVDLQCNPVELSTIIGRAAEATRPLFDGRGREHDRELVVTLPARPIWLNADATRLTQVVGNLLNNAARYTGDNGCAWLTVERDGDDAVVRVRDNGIGIAADQLDRIFEIFTQVEVAPTRARAGLGLGLALVRDLVELHGGQVEVRSEGLGRGSEFIVRLPTIAEPRTVEHHPPAPATTVSGHRVLIVDDNIHSADSLAMLLKLSGNEVDARYNGIDAVTAAEQLRPDIALLDIGMPGLDGLEVCRRIRAHDWGRSMVIIALTGWGQVEDRIRSDQAGFDAHAVKPVKPETLMKLMATLLKTRGK